MAEHDAEPAILSPDQLAHLWAGHLRGEFETKDVEATLATMALGSIRSITRPMVSIPWR
jgi:hypothetical protein